MDSHRPGVTNFVHIGLATRRRTVRGPRQPDRATLGSRQVRRITVSLNVGLGTTMLLAALVAGQINL